MKNYILKLQKSNIPNYILNFRNYIVNFRKNNPFAAIILSIVLTFLLLLYFSLPSFYNYENFDKEIQKKVSKDFKIDLRNIKGIKYLILPSPHFLIEECDLYFANDSQEKFLSAKKLKINVYSKNLYKKEKILIFKYFAFKTASLGSLSKYISHSSIRKCGVGSIKYVTPEIFLRFILKSLDTFFWISLSKFS